MWNIMRRKKKEGKYAKTLAKFQVTVIFRMQDMRRNFLRKFIEICMETVPIRIGTNMAAGNQQKSVTEFCYKSVNLSLKELKHMRVILFLIQELFR